MSGISMMHAPSPRPPMPHTIWMLRYPADRFSLSLKYVLSSKIRAGTANANPHKNTMLRGRVSPSNININTTPSISTRMDTKAFPLLVISL